ALTYSVVSVPAYGIASFVDTNGVTRIITDGMNLGSISHIRYEPILNFNGHDGLTFKANDGSLDSPLGAISITVFPVNDRPAADSQSASVNEDTPLPLTLTGSDPDLDELSFLVDAPLH